MRILELLLDSFSLMRYMFMKMKRWYNVLKMLLEIGAVDSMTTNENLTIFSKYYFM